MTFGGVFEQFHFFLASARTVSSSQDFGVEQFFRADEFRAVDPSPVEAAKFNHGYCYHSVNVIKMAKSQITHSKLLYQYFG
jgi:hypothetical protein